MKEYTIEVREIHSIVVDAKSEEEALDKAEKLAFESVPDQVISTVLNVVGTGSDEETEEVSILPDEITGLLGQLLTEVELPADLHQNVRELYDKAASLLNGIKPEVE